MSSRIWRELAEYHRSAQTRPAVMPAQAGIQASGLLLSACSLDSRFRGNDDPPQHSEKTYPRKPTRGEGTRVRSSGDETF